MPDWAVQRRRAMNGPTTGEFAAAPPESEIESSEPPVLRSLLRISRAVMRAKYFDEALEVIAEQALEALDAASVSISRWDREFDSVRTLINVGSLAPGELRWPDDEMYRVDGDRAVTQLLRHGQPYAFSVDDANLDPKEATWLSSLGKQSEVAVPVMYEDVMWGELWASGVGGRRFGADEIQLLQAIAAYAAVAIGRAELFSTVWRFAHQDPLTGLANRRELERRFDEIDWRTTSAALLIGDLDGFKMINDRDGHPAGDALLRQVGAVLREVTATIPDATAVRLGGDEFCVLLPNCSLKATERLASETSHRVRLMGDGGVTLCWGATVSKPHTVAGQDLLVAADAALLAAKRLGPGRYNVGVGESSVALPLNRRTPGAGVSRSAIDDLVPRVMALLDEHGPLDTVAALEILAVQVHNAIDAAAWSISETTDDGTGVRAVRGVHSLHDDHSGLAILRKIEARTVYALGDYPRTARAVAEGGTFITDVHRDDSDPAEVAVLRELGYDGVLVVGVRGAKRSHLMEIYLARHHREVEAIVPHVRVLAHYCATSGV